MFDLYEIDYISSVLFIVIFGPFALYSVGIMWDVIINTPPMVTRRTFNMLLQTDLKFMVGIYSTILFNVYYILLNIAIVQMNPGDNNVG